MRPIYSFIFNLFTSPLGLPISPLWEYLILLIIEGIAFKIAWTTSPGGFGGITIHWLARVLAFLLLWAVAYIIIATIKFVAAHWIPIVSVIIGLAVTGMIMKVINNRTPI